MQAFQVEMVWVTWVRNGVACTMTGDRDDATHVGEVVASDGASEVAQERRDKGDILGIVC